MVRALALLALMAAARIAAAEPVGMESDIGRYETLASWCPASSSWDFSGGERLGSNSVSFVRSITDAAFERAELGMWAGYGDRGVLTNSPRWWTIGEEPPSNGWAVASRRLDQYSATCATCDDFLYSFSSRTFPGGFFWRGGESASGQSFNGLFALATAGDACFDRGSVAASDWSTNALALADWGAAMPTFDDLDADGVLFTGATPKPFVEQVLRRATTETDASVHPYGDLRSPALADTQVGEIVDGVMACTATPVDLAITNRTRRLAMLATNGWLSAYARVLATSDRTYYALTDEPSEVPTKVEKSFREAATRLTVPEIVIGETGAFLVGRDCASATFAALSNTVYSTVATNYPAKDTGRYFVSETGYSVGSGCRLTNDTLRNEIVLTQALAEEMLGEIVEYETGSGVRTVEFTASVDWDGAGHTTYDLLVIGDEGSAARHFGLAYTNAVLVATAQASRHYERGERIQYPAHVRGLPGYERGFGSVTNCECLALSAVRWYFGADETMPAVYCDSDSVAWRYEERTNLNAYLSREYRTTAWSDLTRQSYAASSNALSLFVDTETVACHNRAREVAEDLLSWDPSDPTNAIAIAESDLGNIGRKIYITGGALSSDVQVQREITLTVEVDDDLETFRIVSPSLPQTLAGVEYEASFQTTFAEPVTNAFPTRRGILAETDTVPVLGVDWRWSAVRRVD